MPTKISLKAARVNANLTILEAADSIGIGKDRLIKWEKNSGLVPPVWQQKIAAAYKVPIDLIFFG
ncbi:MAG: helix-turn-helix transcriptional regulator [Succiniclasticum sp.]|nr:helix-turn-helix transcriptional regulator [Succiniclasticum sp.]